MENDLFGYLIVTKQSMKDINLIAQDYKQTTKLFNEINDLNKSRYSCKIVCFGLSWIERLWLSYKTGIPLLKITGISRICIFGFLIVNDSKRENRYFGRIKVYDSQKSLPLFQFKGMLEIYYSH